MKAVIATVCVQCMYCVKLVRIPLIFPAVSCVAHVVDSFTGFSNHLQCFVGRLAPCGLRGCKNRPTPFPGQMSYKATKPGSVCPLVA